jgi:hypothetical protein
MSGFLAVCVVRNMDSHAQVIPGSSGSKLPNLIALDAYLELMALGLKQALITQKVRRLTGTQ